jgi:ABC-type protease/lipase transport system fused ATPase/permease subunit
MPASFSQLRQAPKSPIVAILGGVKGLIALLFVVGFIVNMLQLTGSVYMMQVYDRVLASQSEATLLALTLISIFLIAIYAILEGCRSFALIGLGRLIDRELASRVFEVLFVQGSLKGSERVGVQPLRDLEQIRSFISTNGLTTSLDVPWIPVFLFILYVIHPVFAWFGSAAVFLVIGSAVLQAFLSTKKLAEASNTNVQAYAFVEASIRNAETAEAMGMRGGVWRRWHQRHVAMLNQQQTASQIASSFSSVIKFLQLVLTGVLTLGLGALLVIEQAITAGGMIVASFILARALAPSMQVVSLWQQATNARAAHKRLREFLAVAPPEKQAMELPTPLGALSVDNLVLGIPGTETLVLRGISFSLAAGESLAIIGPSAAGKSTLARALYGQPRFVVLDEPNSNLDSEGESALAAAIGRLREAGVTTVIITHRASILAAVDKILLLRAGQVEAFGRRDEILPRLTRPAQAPRPISAIANS